MRDALILLVVLACLPLLLVWIVGVLVFWGIWGGLLRLWFWRVHASRGRFILFVYSNSPNWQSYVEANILPRIGDKAVVLNWSERRYWAARHPWEARFFRWFAGEREFNPIALVFGRRGRIEAVRFHRPFRDDRHGSPEALERAEARLYAFAGGDV